MIILLEQQKVNPFRHVGNLDPAASVPEFEYKDRIRLPSAAATFLHRALLGYRVWVEIFRIVQRAWVLGRKENKTFS